MRENKEEAKCLLGGDAGVGARWGLGRVLNFQKELTPPEMSAGINRPQSVV